jgi:hypothetical protein
VNFDVENDMKYFEIGFETINAGGPSPQVPLPNEIPDPPNLNSLPAHILHSGTVETLMEQNDDLASRLKVNLRRNSVLEQQIMEHQSIVDELTNTNVNLLSQVQILLEKDRLTKEKRAAGDWRRDNELQKVDLLKERLLAAEERKNELKCDLRYESAFRRRIDRWVRPLIKKLKEELASERKFVHGIITQLEVKDAALSDLKAKIADQLKYALTIERNFSRDQSRLTEQYEEKIKSYVSELGNLKSEAKLLKEKASRIEHFTKENAELENRGISFERQIAEQNKKLQEAHLQSQAAERMAIQFENLQTMWSESQKRIESLKNQNESLNLINQELVNRLNQGTAESLGKSSQVYSGASLDKVELLMGQIQSGMVKSFAASNESGIPAKSLDN